jgi:hypothetical protein
MKNLDKAIYALWLGFLIGISLTVYVLCLL